MFKRYGDKAVTVPRLKARKVIRLWFDYYKVARTIPELEKNFEASRKVYEPWGDLAEYGYEFEQWWNHRGYQLGAVRVREIYGTVIEPDAVDTVRISIPLSLPVSKALAQVKALIEARQWARMSEMGLDPSNAKSLASGFGSYEVTAKELRSQPLREALSLFMLWRDGGQPAINSDFLQSARDWWKAALPEIGLPSFLVVDPQVDKKGNPRFAEEQIRQTRRSIKKAHDVCVAVSEGRFPA